MTDVCPHGLSGFPDERMDDKYPWIHLQTWREHLEVLVRASQIGTAATGPTHTAGGQEGEPPAANQISQRWGDSLLWHFMGCHGNCMFSSFPMGSLGRMLLKSVSPPYKSSLLLPLSTLPQCTPPHCSRSSGRAPRQTMEPWVGWRKSEQSKGLKYDQHRDGFTGRNGVFERSLSLRGKKKSSILEFMDC